MNKIFTLLSYNCKFQEECSYKSLEVWTAKTLLYTFCIKNCYNYCKSKFTALSIYENIYTIILFIYVFWYCILWELTLCIILITFYSILYLSLWILLLLYNLILDIHLTWLCTCQCRHYVVVLWLFLYSCLWFLLMCFALCLFVFLWYIWLDSVLRHPVIVLLYHCKKVST